jgi:tetratricopeptide (TPR) repeat protein
MNRRDRRATRKSQISPNGPGAGTPVALCAAGFGHLLAGRHLDAQICCQQALAIDSDHANSLHLMGLLCLQANQYDHAVAWIARAIRQDPNPEYLSSLGSTLQRQGRREEALQAFDKAVQLKPEDAELWINLGKILVDLGRPADALLSFQHALELKPRHRDAAYRSGILLYELKRFEEALTHLNLCDDLQPNHALTLQARAATLRGLKRLEEALADNRRAHALDPANPDTCNNTADTLQSLGRPEEALQWFDKTLERRPDSILALNNKAFLLRQLHRFDEAAAVYHRVKALDPDNASADLGLGYLHLLTGHLEAGWTGYQARLKIPSLSAVYPKLSQPMWLGTESIEGKTILIGADEGLGDTIQFARYVPMLAARGARVILAVQDALHPLLSALPGVSQCLPTATAWPAFDLHCPICSLPLAFGTRLDTIPAAKSYLPPPPEAVVKRWDDRLGPRDKLRIGLVWSGNPKHGNDHNRSIPLRMLSRLLDADATFVSLQKDPRPDDQAVLLERTDIIDLTADLTDFIETSALVSCLDLVITVDTSVAHLAGALGCTTWVLLPYTPDYRWLLDRDDSPWYPTMRLFRQTETRDYADVLDRVRSALLTLIAAKQPSSPGFGPTR